MKKLYDDIKKGIDVRQNLSRIRQKIKSDFQREELIEWVEEDLDFIKNALISEDAKTRKNAALLAGDLGIPDLTDMVYDAYEKEDKLFVKCSYLIALQKLDAIEYVESLERRMEALTNMVCTEDNKKHIGEEIRELSVLLMNLVGVKKHEFRGYKESSQLILLTNRDQMEATMEQLEVELPLDIEKVKMMGAGIYLQVSKIDKILPIRTWSDMLFIVDGMKKCEMDPRVAAKTVVESEFLMFMEKRHKGKAPFYFRVEMKTKMPLDKKSSFVKTMSMEIERLSGRTFINSTSNYEAEIRLIENKEGMINMLVKLYSIEDKRFSYRKEVMPTSIKPVDAALLVSLAKEQMIEDARVLDPFCGVGTMLIERQKQVPANTSYGIDVMAEAIDKARLNTEEAGQIIHYINRNFFDFKHEYLFDEIITNMPFVIGRKTEEDVYDIYDEFFEVAKNYLNKNGQIIMYSQNKEFVKRLVKKYDYFIACEWMIQKKKETYLYIIRF